jgi:2-amino-4-hydroxy-6-hydroxymethyldihydropteridine diphosphokinase
LIRLRWSPLFRTEPVGGPPGQPAYFNGVVLVEGVAALEPRPLALLQGLQALEAQFGRQRLEAWGPRTLDLDLLWWGDRRVQSAPLELPHPRLQERSFVLAPLAAIDPLLVPPGPGAAGTPSPGFGPRPGQDCGTLLAALLPRLREAAPQRLPGRAGWPE